MPAYTDPEPADRHALFFIEAVVAGLVCGFFFAAAYIGYAFWFEAALMPGLRGAGPSLSYGQQSGVALFLTAGLGSLVGFAFAIGRHFSLFIGALPPAFGASGLAAMTWFTWQSSIARYGRDPSDWIVYVPPLCLSIVVCGIALIVALVGTVGGTRSRASDSESKTTKD